MDKDDYIAAKSPRSKPLDVGSEFFTKTRIIFGAIHHRHPNGGGWVAETATVDETAFVGIDARVADVACVLDSARITEDALIAGTACVCERAIVEGCGRVLENAKVSGSAKIQGSATIYGNAEVTNIALIGDYARVYGDARVYDGATVGGRSKISGRARVHGDSCVVGESIIEGNANVDDFRYLKDVCEYGHINLLVAEKERPECRICGKYKTARGTPMKRFYGPKKDMCLVCFHKHHKKEAKKPNLTNGTGRCLIL